MTTDALPAPLPDGLSGALPAEARDIIATLGLAPHPEGGWYREVFRDAASQQPRGACTAIYYLLAAGERSHWHRVDAVEVWHVYAGGPLRLRIVSEAGREDLVLGADLGAGERPLAVVPAHAWQAAEPLGAWVLCGCTVSPGFDFSGFELAPPGFEP